MDNRSADAMDKSMVLRIPEGTEEIKDGEYKGNKDVRVVIVPPGVTRIGKEAFKNCTSLVEIQLPGTLDIIDDYAFDGCGRLVSADLPEMVFDIGKCAFGRCYRFPGFKKDKGGNYFAEDGILYDYRDRSVAIVPPGYTGTVVINRTVDTVQPYAFDRMRKLEEVVFLKAPKTLARHAINGCKNLRVFRVLVNKNRYTDDCSLIDRTGKKLLRVAPATRGHLEMDDSITDVAEGSFDDCDKIWSVRLSSRLKTVNWSTLAGIGVNSYVDIPSDSVTTFKVDMGNWEGKTLETKDLYGHVCKWS